VAKASKRKPKSAKKPTKKLALVTLGDYFEGVAANVPTCGLEDALQTCIDMYTYDMPTELARLQREATSALNDGRMAEALALVTKWKLDLDASGTERVLKQIVEAERYEGVDE
jgi:hypothetical protein